MEYGDECANYHLMNAKAYTEDDLLVYNVFIRNVPKNATNEEVLEYFKKFGVRFLNEDQTMCFVNFSDPLSATKALQYSRNYKLNKEHICVRACASWHQPDAQPTAATACDDTTTNDALILTLNDDCLDVIFKNLKLKDQINLAWCCNRLKDVFAMRAKIDYKILDLWELGFLTLWQARQFIQMAGSQIKKLKSYTHILQFIESLGIYCTSVKSVSLNCAKLTANDLRKLLKNMSMVEELTLNRVFLVDDCILVLKELKNLKILSLERNNYLTGENIMDLTTVESLYLAECNGIDSISFTKICENLKDLKYLDIQNCSGLKSSDIQHNAKYLHKLETFKLSCDNDQVDWIATLPNLKHLVLDIEYFCDPMPLQIFVELAKHRAGQMESLAVYGINCITAETISFIGELRQLKELVCPDNDYFDDNCLKKISQLQELQLLDIQNCKYFTGKGLLDFIQKCSKLNTVNVSQCKQLNQEFATKTMELLKSKKTERGERKALKIIAHGSGIRKFEVKTPAFVSATELLPISFECEMDNFTESESVFDEYIDSYGDDSDNYDDDYFFRNFR